MDIMTFWSISVYNRAFSGGLAWMGRGEGGGGGAMAGGGGCRGLGTGAGSGFVFNGTKQ